MNHLVGIGECMVEMLQADEGSGSSFWRQGFAGDVLNTLWYAKALLAEQQVVSFYSAVGEDWFSDEMLAFLGAAGIETAALRRLPGKMPGLYTIHLDDGERSFQYWRDTSAARNMLSDTAPLRQLLQSCSHVYFSGITLAILGKDSAQLLDMIAAAKENGVTVFFDSNIRPVLWASQQQFETAIERAAQCADFLLPSFDDESAAFGDASPAETIARYQSLGAGTIVVKQGTHPTVVSQNGKLSEYPVTAVSSVVDTTAAGDSFNGAFIASIMSGESLASAVRSGQQMAAKVVQQHGALI